MHARTRGASKCNDAKRAPSPMPGPQSRGHGRHASRADRFFREVDEAAAWAMTPNICGRLIIGILMAFIGCAVSSAIGSVSRSHTDSLCSFDHTPHSNLTSPVPCEADITLPVSGVNIAVMLLQRFLAACYTFWPPVFRFTHGMYLLLFLQPVFMLACQCMPTLMASLITNPHTSTFRANITKNGLNFQTINLLVYHTSLTDRVLHVTSFITDAFAQASICVHGWGPLVMQAVAQFCEFLGVAPALWWWAGVLSLTGIAALYALQMRSLGGIRLMLGMIVVWGSIFFMLLTTEALLFIDLTAALSDALSLRFACLLLLLGTLLREFGHSTDHQHVGIIGNHTFMGAWTAPTLEEWTQHPVPTLLRAFMYSVRILVILAAAGMAEFNAGQPFRLFPVVIHLAMLRMKLNAGPLLSELENVGGPGGAGGSTNSAAAAAPTNDLMDLEEINRTASYIVANGWAKCTADVAWQLHHRPATLVSNAAAAAENAETQLASKIARAVSTGSPTSASVAARSPKSARRFSLPADSPRSSALKSSSVWHSRRFSAMDLQGSYHFSPESTMLFQNGGRVIPVEKDGYQCWGLWPELQLQTQPIAATYKGSSTDPEASTGRKRGTTI